MKCFISHLHNNKGSVLIVGLFTLALLSLLGSASTSTSRTDISISGNARIIQEAFYAAEAGLAEGEQFIDTMANEFVVNENNVGHYKKGQQNLNAMEWDGNDSIAVPLTIPNSYRQMALPPRYTVEKRQFILDSLKLGKVPTGVHHYNITANGTGTSPNTKSVVRSVFAMRFN